MGNIISYICIYSVTIKTDLGFLKVVCLEKSVEEGAKPRKIIKYFLFI